MDAYLTADEYRASPSSVATSSLVTDGQIAAQNAALNMRIRVASDWISNTVCQQSLVASQRTETRRVDGKSVSFGDLRLIPSTRNVPITLNRLWLGFYPSDIQEVTNLTDVWVDQGGMFAVPWTIYAGQPLVRFTYTAGWPNTLLTATAAAAATSITVASAAGITVGGSLTIADGALTETVTVSNVAGAVLTISPLAFAHSSGVAVHDMPGAVKEAAVLAVSGLITGGRGSDSVVMATIGAPPTQTVGQEPVRSANLQAAAAMLAPYVRTS